MFVNFACLARYSWIHSERKFFYSYIFYLYWNSIIFFWFASSSLFRPQIVPFLLLNKSDEDHVCLQVLWNMISTEVLMLCSVDVRYLTERYILFLSVLETLHSECLSFSLRLSLFFAPPCHPLAWSIHYSNRCPRIPFSGVFFHFLLSSNPSFLL